MAPSPCYSYASRGQREQNEHPWQHPSVSALYYDRAESRTDFPSHHNRAATPPPGARGAYAPSPPRDFGHPTARPQHSWIADPHSRVDACKAPAAPSWAKHQQAWADAPAAAAPRIRGTQAYHRNGTTGALIPGDGGSGYCIVFDMDETMCYARAGPVRARPGLQDVLSTVGGGRCEVVVWTAGEKTYADGALRSVGAAGVVHHVVARDGRWWREGCTKDLSRLGRDLSRTLIIENTAQCVQDNADAAILVPDFSGGHHDSAMPQLARVLSGLLSSGQTVQDYLRACPLLTARQVRASSSGKVFSAFTLRDHVPDDAIERSQAPAYSYAGGYGAYNTPAYAPPTQQYSRRHDSSYGAAYGQTA